MINIIWQPKADYDLLWNLIHTMLLEMSHMSLTSLLQGAPYINHMQFFVIETYWCCHRNAVRFPRLPAVAA